MLSGNNGTRVPVVVVERNTRGNTWVVIQRGKQPRFVRELVLHAPEFRVHHKGHMIIAGLEAESAPEIDWESLTFDGKTVKLPDSPFPVRYSQYAKLDNRGRVWAA
ncbi:hypothetical protein PBI_MARYV_144 [Mycobacterium phage MaryV]|uniref:Uncharacterized protein n=1 Tax=Mycobacterium phage MaryV TaxID=2656593 RepID=A0A649VCJ7_9CAUD|nr:hypothetical protein PBI_MARYV_144 [Mycobacterium phage MaryV]